MKPNILVLCTGNSCRSQIAEGFLRSLAGDRFQVHSAGTEPKDEVHPLAVQVMSEVGIDITRQRPQGVREFLGKLPIQYLIIVCSEADKSCPKIFPGMSERLYWPFDDPASFTGDKESTLNEFRRVRDQVRTRIEKWLS